MNICNCHIDLNKILCDIPAEWRKGIVDALCLALQPTTITCDAIRDCQTLTSLSAFTIQGGEVFLNYTNERGNIREASFDLDDLLMEVGEDIDGSCAGDFTGNTIVETIEAIIENYCNCCPTTTTTSTTTTTTVCYDYYLADEYDCVAFTGVCNNTADNVPVAVPCGFENVPGTYYPDTDNSLHKFLIITSSEFDEDAVILDTDAGVLSCNTGCPTTTTTTSTSTTTTSSSTTTTTTCCPVEGAVVVEITTTTTTTSSTTTTTTAP